MGCGGWGRNPEVNAYKPSVVAHGGNQRHFSRTAGTSARERLAFVRAALYF